MTRKQGPGRKPPQGLAERTVPNSMLVAQASQLTGTGACADTRKAAKANAFERRKPCACRGHCTAEGDHYRQDHTPFSVQWSEAELGWIWEDDFGPATGPFQTAEEALVDACDSALR